MRNVLVVDDHADNRYMLRALFEGHGFVVTEAADGNEALDRAHAGAPDVIVSDLLMPVLDGYAFLRKCKHDPALKHVPFIVYTATYTDPQDERLALDLGASAFLVKPAEPNVFMARVRDVLQEVGGPGTELPTPIDEGLVLREYNEALVRRLEAKRVELEVAYQEVAKREARLRAILEAEPEGIVVLHRDGALLEVNPAGQAILGKGRDESFVGGLFVDRVGDEYRPTVERQIAQALLGAASTEEIALMVDDAARFVRLRAVPLEGDRASGRQVLAHITDLTDQRALQGQLLQAQKMDAVGQLAGGVAHDFNNLLAAVLLNAHLLAGEALSLDARESLDAIKNAADHATALTRQLLLFGRRQPMQVRRLDLNEVVSDLMKMLRRMLEESIEVSLELSPEELPLRADAAMVQQVLMNLALNARDAMPSGGRLSIRTRRSTLPDAGPARARELPPGDYALLEVSDTGIGIPADVAQRMFEPFFTTKGREKGTGLGLATVFTVVGQHGGLIDVESQEGEGATFRVYLPLHEGAEAGGLAEPAKDAEPPWGQGEVVLLVEDDPGFRSAAHRVLTRRGYRVLEAESGPAAVACFEAAGGAVDLLLTDLVLPGGMRGEELATILGSRAPGLRVAFMSGHDPDGVSGRGGCPVAIDLHKPTTIEALLRAVRRALGGS